MFKGNTFPINCAQGGVTDSINMDAIPPFMMLSSSKNINLHNGGREKRGGTDKVGSQSAGSLIHKGIFQAQYEDGNNYIMTVGDNGKIYKDSAELNTGLDGTNKYWFVMGDNLCFTCNESQAPMTSIDGAAFVALGAGELSADWAGSSFPAYMVVHGRGLSRRMWAFGIPSATTATAIKTVYYSKLGDLKDFSDADSGTIIIETEDGSGIVGGVEFGSQLIFFTKTRAYIITDSSATTNTWGYTQAQWKGGVAHQRLIVKTPNDVVCMEESGEIYSVTATQHFGDYKAASLSRPSWMHRWIQDNVDLSRIEDFHAQYDERLRAIKIFVWLNGDSKATTCLIYFIDRGPAEGWMIHDAAVTASGYNASASCIARDSNSVPWVYSGDYDGYVWKLETTNFHDDSNAFDCVIELPYIYIDNPAAFKMFKRFGIITQSKGTATLVMTSEIDGVGGPGASLELTSAGDSLGTGVLDTFQLGSEDKVPERDNFYLNRRGQRVKIKLTNSSITSDFYISHFLLDYKSLGLRLE